MTILGFGLVTCVRAETGTNFMASGLLLNGDFEATPFDFSWLNKDKVGLLHPGLNGTTHAVVLTTAVTNEFEQQFDPVGPRYRLEMSFAAAEPVEQQGIHRPSSFDVMLRMGARPGDGQGIIYLRVLQGNILAYVKPDGSHEALLTDFKYSTDKDGNHDFTKGAGDVLNVYRLRVDVTVAGTNSTWTLSLSEANAKSFTRTFPGLSFTTVPQSGEFGLDEIKLRRLADTTGAAVYDELTLFKGTEK